MKRNMLTLALVAVSSLILVACGGPSFEEVRERTTSLIKPMLKDTAKAVEQLSKHKAFETLLGGRSVSGLFSSSTDDTVGVDPSVTEPIPGSSQGELMVDEEIDLDEVIAKLEEIADKIFTEANVESSGGGTTTFLVPGSVLCSDDRPPVASGGGMQPPSADPLGPSSDAEKGPSADREALPPSPAMDNDCVEMVDRIELRIDASFAGDGVNLAFRVGKADGAAAVLELRPGRMTAKVLLAAMADAIRDIATAAKEELEGMPTTLKGTLALTLKKNDNELTAELAVADAIEVAGKVKGDAYRVQLPVTDRLASVTYDLDSDELRAGLSWPAMEWLLPGNAIWRDELKSSLDKPLRLLLGGIKLDARATSDGKLHVEQLALGSADLPRLLLGDDPLAKLTLGEDKVKLEVAPYNDTARCTFDAGFDVGAELRFDRLDSYLKEPMPSWAANERYQVTLAKSGTDKPALVPMLVHEATTCSPQPAKPGMPAAPEPRPRPENPEDVPPRPDTDTSCGSSGPTSVVELLSGKLTLQSFVNPQKIVVEAGQCLNVSDGEGEGPFAGLAAGPCVE